MFFNLISSEEIFMKLIKLIPCLLLVLVLALTFVGCDEEQPTPAESSGLTEQSTPTPEEEVVDDTVTIELTGSGYTASKSGVVSASGNVLTITAAGKYKITGTLDNAQLRISVQKTEIVDLIFAGISITNKTNAPLYIECADKVSIELEAGTENVLTDAKTYILPEGEDKPNYKQLFSQRIFIMMLILMVCSGASELAVAQWASSFAETALKLDKTMGDLLGVCGFSLTMAIARMGYAKFSERLPLKKAMLFCVVLCIISYLMIGLSSSAVVGLIGCIICGFSVGLFWPGTFSLATVSVKGCSTTMFALLALAGDMGCSSGPTVVGLVAGMTESGFRGGILAAVVFPILLLVGLLLLSKTKDPSQNLEK